MKTIARILSRSCVAMFPLLSGFLAIPALAQNTQSSSDWQYEVTPYLWAAGLDGETTVGSRTRSTSVSFNDILKKVDFGLTGTFEARKDRWGILFDGIYVDLSDSKSIGPGSIDAHIKQQMYSLAAAYRLAEAPAAWDLLGGARYISVRSALNAGMGSLSNSQDGWGPFIGARVMYPLAPRWTLVGYGDIGRVGSGSTWQLLGGVNYEFKQNINGKFGYRHFNTDFDKGNLHYDMALSGFYIGVGFRF